MPYRLLIVRALMRRTAVGMASAPGLTILLWHARILADRLCIVLCDLLARPDQANTRLVRQTTYAPCCLLSPSGLPGTRGWLDYRELLVLTTGVYEGHTASKERHGVRKPW